jgi:hypothetical protein
MISQRIRQELTTSSLKFSSLGQRHGTIDMIFIPELKSFSQ